MTPEEHYQQAEAWAQRAKDLYDCEDAIPEDAQNTAAIAQVHATLATYRPPAVAQPVTITGVTARDVAKLVDRANQETKNR